MSQKQKYTQAGAVMTLALVLVTGFGVLRNGTETRAADAVCGDDVRDTGEECDDGNLQNGDGCSNYCTIEECGNKRIDVNEQCDDGNTRANDGCNQYCQIEFCGDRKVQQILGEECDDGNGISGDGCSNRCQAENKITGDEVLRPAADELTPDSIAEIARQAIMAEAKQVIQFLVTPDGKDIAQYLNREENIQLEQIMQKLENGRRLTPQERKWAEALVQKLEEAKVAERGRYTDLLKQFISTPISSEVVDEKSLDSGKLVDVAVPIAIEELNRAVDVIRRGELKNQVQLDLGKLKRQFIQIDNDIPANYESYLATGSRPIEVFATLKSLKEATEKYATENLPLSLEMIRNQVITLTEALPILERDYGINPAEVTEILADVTQVSTEVGNADSYRVVAAVNRLLAFLERNKVFTAADAATINLQSAHNAARGLRIASTVETDATIVTQEDLTAFVTDVASTAPAEYRETFEEGSAEEQRDIVITMLKTDARVIYMRDVLKGETALEFNRRFADLLDALEQVGEVRDDYDTCNDSMADALKCSNDYLADLQTAVRNRNIFTRTVGNLQDFFGIGNE